MQSGNKTTANCIHTITLVSPYLNSRPPPTIQAYLVHIHPSHQSFHIPPFILYSELFIIKYYSAIYQYIYELLRYSSSWLLYFSLLASGIEVASLKYINNIIEKKIKLFLVLLLAGSVAYTTLLWPSLTASWTDVCGERIWQSVRHTVRLMPKIRQTSREHGTSWRLLSCTHCLFWKIYWFSYNCVLLISLTYNLTIWKFFVLSLYKNDYSQRKILT